MHSTAIKRSLVLDGQKTSASLEDEFWKGLKEIAAARSTTLSGLVATIDSGRLQGNLSSTIQLFVLESFQERAQRGRAGPLSPPPGRRRRAISTPGGGGPRPRRAPA
jgi:predicted DNA-binding ribbon-helix-helix protein